VGPFEVFPERINLYEIDERYEGFREALGANPGVEGVLLDGADYVERLHAVDLRAVRTAVLCASDIFALEILRALRARGIEAPRDIGLMGFDAIDALRYVVPALSTVEYPIQRMAEEAFALLIDAPQTTDGAPSIELEPRIHWGESL